MKEKFVVFTIGDTVEDSKVWGLFKTKQLAEDWAKENFGEYGWTALMFIKSDQLTPECNPTPTLKLIK